MKKTKGRLIIPIALSSVLLFSACSVQDPLLFEDTAESTLTQSSDVDHSKIIKELEEKILLIQQNQSLSDAEQQKELNRLQDLLAELKNQVSGKNPEQTDSNATDTEESSAGSDSNPIPQFLYSRNGDTAIITGYTGSDTHLVIPSEIDGYRVIAIGDSAFSSQNLKSVIVSNGIEKLDWFAFLHCPALISVTLPDSVTSIGYSAFAPQSKTFTIYCHNNSFAHKYAESYGWNYAII